MQFTDNQLNLIINYTEKLGEVISIGQNFSL